MYSQKSILKTLFSFSLFLLIVIIIKNNSQGIRIRIVDYSTPVLKSLQAIPAIAKRAIPFAGLREENALLGNRVDYLSRKIEEMQAVLRENERLKEVLDFRKTVPYTTIPAQVIGRDSSNWSGSIIIDKGLNHGIRQNKAVLSVKGLVGRVIEVGRFSSKVLLITDPNSKVGVIIGRNRQGGILVGRPDGKCKMVYIALDSDARPGDKVVTAGFGSIFPKDIIIGEVMKVEKEPGRLYKYAIVKPIQDLSKVEEVLCIR